MGRTGYSLSLLVLLLFIGRSNLSAQVPARYNIIIDELFPDPSPVIGLPNSEFIELKNVSATAFNLRNWKISDGTSTATININYLLKPDSFVIICPAASASAYTAFGATVGVSSFPSLNNDADIITLLSPQGNIIHAVGYDLSWYCNDVKAGGGWTLEMIDTRNPCSGSSNWIAATGATGGTPGRKNTADASNPDNTLPALLYTYTIDSVTIIAVFDEPLDSASGTNTANFQVDEAIGQPLKAIPQAPLFNEVMLRLQMPLNADSIYRLTIYNVKDCTGNSIGAFNTTRAGLPVLPGPGQIIINEILFNPPPDGYDYVELYNDGHRIVDLKQLLIANRNDNGTLANIVPLSNAAALFFPGEYRVITADRAWLQQHYAVKNPSWIIVPATMPSLPDNKGAVVISHIQGTVTDELHYDEKWHFALIANNEGVALERIDPHQPAQNKSNWTSAASVIGFGTPTWQNSQFKTSQQLQGQITIDPAIFSPDNDGMNDLATLYYQFPSPGLVANITIFDANGRPVRYLARNATLLSSGYFRWDGLDDDQRKLPAGIYIMLTETFNTQGAIRRFKNVVTLVRRF